MGLFLFTSRLTGTSCQQCPPVALRLSVLLLLSYSYTLPHTKIRQHTLAPLPPPFKMEKTRAPAEEKKLKLQAGQACQAPFRSGTLRQGAYRLSPPPVGGQQLTAGPPLALQRRLPGHLGVRLTRSHQQGISVSGSLVPTNNCVDWSPPGRGLPSCFSTLHDGEDTGS